jgi:WW domain-containing oxidoreductase
MALKGAHVIMACRSKPKMIEAKEIIQKQNKNAKITCLELDLGDLKNIRKFVKDFAALNLPLHILISNAGITGKSKISLKFKGGPTRETTVDGFESNMGINHFGTFAVTTLLVPFMVKTAKECGQEGRIVVLTSYAYTALGSGRIEWDNLHFTKPGTYGVWYAYAQSKLGNVLFANELNRRLKGTNITVNSVHPGTIKTQSSKDVRGTFFYNFLQLTGYFFFKTLEEGTSPQVYAAVHPELNGKGGLLICDCNICPMSSYSQDQEVQKRFFEVSEKETGVSLQLE